MLGVVARLRVVVLGLLLALVAAVLPAVTVAAAAAEPVVWQPGPARREPVGGRPDGGGGPRYGAAAERVAELVERRTERSATWVRSDGLLEAEVSAAPLHVPDGRGGWERIDLSLVREGDGWVPRRSGRAGVRLPADLAAGPVVVSGEAASVSFALEGAAASAGEAAGASVSYAGVLPGVDAVYTALAEGVKEELVLADAAVTRRFGFAVDAGGLAVRASRDGGLELVDADGGVAAVVSPPFMVDAAGAVSHDVTLRVAGEDPLRVELVAADGWLDAPERVWPVTVDPNVHLTTNTQGDTFVDSSAPTTTHSSSPYLRVGTSGGGVRRSLLGFDVEAAITEPVVVYNAEVHVWVDSTSGSPQVAAHAVTRDWMSCATWQLATCSVSWTSQGGDYQATAENVVTVDTAASHPSLQPIHVESLVVDWLHGDRDNHGVLLKLADESTTAEVWYRSRNHTAGSSTEPKLWVQYKPLTGLRPYCTYVSEELSDRRSVHVNVASGNATVVEEDLRIGGTAGLDLSLRRFYDTLLPGHTFAYDTENWALWPATFARLYFQSGGDMLFERDVLWLFDRQVDGTFRSPHGIRATLEALSGGGLELGFHDSGEVWAFTSGGHLAGIRDRHGNKITISYTYDSTAGQWVASSITDTQGRVTTLTRTGPYQVDEVTDPAGRTIGYGYTNGLLSSVTDAANHTTGYAYDTSERLDTITDARGVVTDFGYDTAGRVTSITYAKGRTEETTTTFDYSVAGQTTVTDGNNHATVYHYDIRGRVTKVVDALGHERSTTYTPDSNVDTYTDRTGGTPVVNSYTTDGLANLASVQLPTGATTTLAYGDLDNRYAPSTITSPQQTAVTIDYDTAGRVDTVTDQQTSCLNGCQVDVDYNLDGTVDRVTDPRGTVTDYGYDADGNRTSVTPPAPLGGTTIGYDTLSRVTSVTDGNNHTTTYGYDTLDRVTLITYHDTTTVSYSYDAAGNRTSRTDPTGTTTITPDGLNRVTAEAFPGGRSTSYSYDDAGNLTSLTDPAGTVTYGYNAVNLVETVTVGTDTTTFGYDVANNRTSTTYPNGVVETADYDTSNRLKRITGTDALSTVLTDFQYSYADPVSNADTTLRQSVTDRLGHTTTYGYDEVDRLDSAVTRDSGSIVLESFAYGYDPAGNRTSVTHDGDTDLADYNTANQLIHTAPDPRAVLLVVGDSAAPATVDQTLKTRLEGLGGTVTYRDDSATATTTGVDLVVISETVNSGTLGTKYSTAAVPIVNLEQGAWDDHNLSSAPYASQLHSSLYVHDAAHPVADGYHAQLTGTITQASSAQNVGVAALTALGADARVVLKPTATSGYASAFTYDTGDAMANSTTAPARRVALGWHGNTIANITADGWKVFDNTIAWAAGGTRHTYDGDGNLTGTSDDAQAFTYNTADQTTAMRTTPDGATLTATYAGDGQYERVTHGATTSTTSTTSLLGVTAQTTGTTTVGYTRDDGGFLLGLRDGLTRGYYLHDGLGSIAAVTNTTGAVVNRYDYTPYGQTSETQLTGALTNPWRYTGHHQDTTTGLYKAGIRYYEPDHGRWTQQDPALNPYQTDYGNRYLYGFASPVNAIDMTGAHALQCVTSVLGGITGGVGVAETAYALATASTGVGIVAGTLLLAYQVYGLYEASSGVSQYC